MQLTSTLAVLASFGASAMAASLQQISNFGSNPTGEHQCDSNWWQQRLTLHTFRHADVFVQARQHSGFASGPRRGTDTFYIIARCF
jgi:hypothetical protein